MNEKIIFHKKNLLLFTIVAIAAVIITIYFVLSHQAQATNAIGLQTYTSNQENYEFIQKSLSINHSEFLLLISNEVGIYAYEQYYLDRVFPYFDNESQQFIYWSVQKKTGEFLPHDIVSKEEAVDYIESTNEDRTTTISPMAECGTNYYSICNPDGLSSSVKDFTGLEKFMSSNEAWNTLGFPSNRITGGGQGPSNGLPTRDYVLSDPGLNFLVIAFDTDPYKNPDSSMIQAVYIVTSNNSFIEVQADENNIFDFEAAINKM